jgi:hypothetical protein
MLPLRELQSHFFRAIACEPGKSHGFDPILVRTVQERGPLSAEERVNIYAQMYVARLLDALYEDFPRVAAYLGFERFRDLVRAYLKEHPSTHPSLRYIGRHFANFLDTQPEIREALPFLFDLARLEWTRLEIFDAPDAEPLQLQHLQHIPPEEWPALQFQVIPACRMLHSTWPIHEIWAAAQEEPQPEQVRPRETAVRIWRQEFAVYHVSMDTVEQRALEHVQQGKPFADICAALESFFPPEDAAREVGSLLVRWIEDGLLVQFPGI